MGSPSVACRDDPPDLAALGIPLPRVVIFDLDDTCWRQALDRKGFKGAPFRWDPTCKTVLDTRSTPVRLYPEVPSVLLALRQAGVQVAVASHNSRPAWVSEVIDKIVVDEEVGLVWGQLVPEELRVVEWRGKYYPTKNEHIREICARLPAGPCSPTEAVIFDDSKQACTGASAMGVTAVRCMDGMSISHLLAGVGAWAA